MIHPWGHDAGKSLISQLVQLKHVLIVIPKQLYQPEQWGLIIPESCSNHSRRTFREIFGIAKSGMVKAGTHEPGRKKLGESLIHHISIISMRWRGQRLQAPALSCRNSLFFFPPLEKIHGIILGSYLDELVQRGSNFSSLFRELPFSNVRNKETSWPCTVWPRIIPVQNDFHPSWETNCSNWTRKFQAILSLQPLMNFKEIYWY